MSVAVDAVSTGTADAATVTIQHTASGVDRAVIVNVHVRDDENNAVTIDSATYDGVAMTKVIDQSDATGSDRVIAAQFELANPPTTANVDVVITISAQAQLVGGVISVTGADQTTVTENHQFDTGASPSVTVTSKVGDLVLDAITSRTSSPIPDADASQTEHYSVGLSKVRTGASTKAGAASVVMSWTNTNSDCVLVASNIRAAVAVVRDRLHVHAEC